MSNISCRIFSCRCSDEPNSGNLQNLATLNSEIEQFCKNHKVIKIGDPIVSVYNGASSYYSRITIKVEYNI